MIRNYLWSWFVFCQSLISSVRSVCRPWREWLEKGAGKNVLRLTLCKAGGQLRNVFGFFHRVFYLHIQSLIFLLRHAPAITRLKLRLSQFRPGFFHSVLSPCAYSWFHLLLKTF